MKMQKHAVLLYKDKTAFKIEMQNTFWKRRFCSTDRLEQNVWLFQKVAINKNLLDQYFEFQNLW